LTEKNHYYKINKNISINQPIITTDYTIYSYIYSVVKL